MQLPGDMVLKCPSDVRRLYTLELFYFFYWGGGGHKAIRGCHVNTSGHFIVQGALSRHFDHVLLVRV